jgi:hypothetical protein
MLFVGSDENLVRFVFAQSEIVPAYFDFNRIAERRKTHQLHFGPNQQPHLHQTRTTFGRKLDFHHRRCASYANQGKGLKGRRSGHDLASGVGIVSTKMASASCSLIPKRALQT